jgi:hypothetical protein
MESPARAQLVRDQEQTLHEIERLRSVLTTAAEMLLALGQKLKTQPEEVVFTNAPDGLGDLPAAYCYLLTGAGLDWNAIPEKRHIAELIQELRTTMSQLTIIQRQLR